MGIENSSQPSGEQVRHHLHELCAELDRETLALSGGFERLESYQQLVAEGEVALMILLEDLLEDDAENRSWWKLTAAKAIAENLSNAPVCIPEESLGIYGEVRENIITWGRSHGLLEEAS